MHSRDNADSEYILYVGVDRKAAEFTGNKTNIHINSHTDTQLYILVEI